MSRPDWCAADARASCEIVDAQRTGRRRPISREIMSCIDPEAVVRGGSVECTLVTCEHEGMKFDWIDFGVAWKEADAIRSSVETLFHNSTASLLAKMLRGRAAPFRKAFCWMRSATEIIERSDTPGIRHIDATFPFQLYAASNNSERLTVFARWLVETLASGAPELVRGGEIEALVSKLADDQYVYRRSDKLKREAGGVRCVVKYTHTPTELQVTASCVLPGGAKVVRALTHERLSRDELVYGRAITHAAVGPGNTMVLGTYFGEI